MSFAAVTVIMPVFNADKYLQMAVDSILNQTMRDFEFIIVNDCSTDASDEIIRSFTDSRIRYITHECNKGVVAAMNSALDATTSPFVAVMHADDVSFKQRLELEYNYLISHSQCAVIVGKTVFINEDGKETGMKWELDNKATSAIAIRKAMIRENCITHSTAMIRTEILKRYRYKSSPDHKGFAVEDYPLWLNILSDGYEIHKLNENILYYRTHTTSATTTFLRKKNPFLINYYTKKFYLKTRKEQGVYTAFDRKVKRSALLDYIMGILKNIKQGFKG